jgi:hypothetical protein
MKLLLSLFMIKNILYNNIITKINNDSNKNSNLGNDERNEKYFTNDTCEIAKIARNMDILDRIDKLKNIHNIHYEIENMRKIDIKPGNINPFKNSNGTF